MTIRQFIKKLFVTIIMIGIVLAALLKVGYILICKVIVVIIFVVLAIRYWVGEDIRKAEEEKRGTWLFTLGFIGLTVLTMLAANIPGQVQQDQYLYLTKEHTEQLGTVKGAYSGMKSRCWASGIIRRLGIRLCRRRMKDSIRTASMEKKCTGIRIHILYV